MVIFLRSNCRAWQTAHWGPRPPALLPWSWGPSEGPVCTSPAIDGAPTPCLSVESVLGATKTTITAKSNANVLFTTWLSLVFLCSPPPHLLPFPNSDYDLNTHDYSVIFLGNLPAPLPLLLWGSISINSTATSRHPWSGAGLGTLLSHSSQSL